MPDGLQSIPFQPPGDPLETPLEQLNPGHPGYFFNDSQAATFARLRREDPVHYCSESEWGPYWSVTKYQDIMTVDTSHQIYSSKAELGGIVIRDFDDDFRLPMFIAMDPPKHDEQRKVVQPIVAPANLAKLSGTIRERTVRVLESLPKNETFDWVDRVSIELTTQMLATLFDFPWEERRKLTRWSDVATAIPGAGVIDTEEQRRMELFQCADYFLNLWNERVNAPPKPDLVSMLAHGEATRNMDRMEFLGNLMLLIVGGNDTTRNSMTAGIVALNENPDQYAKLRGNPALIESLVPEVIRWQTPLAHMRRTALEDAELGGKQIKAGDKVVMWYVSGNRDASTIENPDAFIIDRARPRMHLSFGFGIHRCVGNRLAELQLQILWEELLQRYPNVEVVGPPERTYSSFVRGYTKLPVRIAA